MERNLVAEYRRMPDASQPAKRRSPAQAAAISWVEKAIAAGLDPQMKQRPLRYDDAGEWEIATRKTAIGGRAEPPLEEYFDEILIVLEDMNRVLNVPSLQCWHGEVMPDDCSARAIAFRLRLACRSLKAMQAEFFGFWQILPGLTRDYPWVAEDLSHLFELAAYDIIHHYAIPEEWIFFGVACEISVPTPQPGIGTAE